jgi:hypothetical protein
MENQTKVTEIQAISHPLTQKTLLRTLFTVEQFSEYQPAFTKSALRNLIHGAEARNSTRGVIHGNGLLECGAIVRVGRKVLIEGEKFLGWAKARGAQDAQSRIVMGV